MSNYKETDIQASGYQRCHTIVIQNPYGQKPVVTFQEEAIYIKAGSNEVFHDKLIADSQGGVLLKNVNDYNEMFTLWNPSTQTRTDKQVSMGEVYALIWSVYMNEALKRDAGIAKQKFIDDFWAEDKVKRDTQGFQVKALEDAFLQQDATDLATAEAAAQALEDQFVEQDALDKAAAEELAATKETDEEKQAVMIAYEEAKAQKRMATDNEKQDIMDAYGQARLVKLAELQAQITPITDAYNTWKNARLSTLEADAQAAYDAVING